MRFEPALFTHPTARVAYEAWSEDGARPTRMTLSYPGMQLRLAISDWRLPR